MSGGPIRNPRRYEDDYPPLPPVSSISRRPPPYHRPGPSPGGRHRPERRFGRFFPANRPEPFYPSALGYDPVGPPYGAAAEPDLPDIRTVLPDYDDLATVPAGANTPRMPPPPPSTSPPPQAQRDYHPDDSRRIKRRKLDSDRLGGPTFRGPLRYGRYGQVEAGPLTMEIVSCDGGMFSNEPSYAAENILRNDNSVYCTRSNRCNIVLRHQGGAAFSLKELIIKAPGSNYSSPVREGMVFVTMNSDEILNRTTRYQIQCAPTPSHGSSSPRHYARGAAELDRRDLDPRTIVSVRHDDGGTTTVIANPYRRARRLYGMPIDDDADHGHPSRRMQLPATAEQVTEMREHRRQQAAAAAATATVEANMPAEFTGTLPPYTITAECSDDETDAEGGNGAGGGTGTGVAGASRGSRPPPNRIGSLPFESDSGGEDGSPFDYGFEDMSVDGGSGGLRSRGSAALLSLHQRLRDRERDRELRERDRDRDRDRDGVERERERERELRDRDRDLGAAAEASQAATQEAVRAVGGTLMTPHARFFIEKDKSKCTLTFHPPVSGRFILLKMWSPMLDPMSNIDIQSVIARGFAGPRYFPSVQPR